jgi:uncharacterized protein (DUF1778 family)
MPSDKLAAGAAAAAGTDRTTFVVTNAIEAAGRVADRTVFELDAEGLAEWEAINRCRARDLRGLRRLMARPSSLAD